jgi:hypothetical protein
MLIHRAIGRVRTRSDAGNYNARTVIDDAYRIVPGKGNSRIPDIPVVVVRRGEVRMGEEPLPDGAPLTPADVDAINEAQREGKCGGPRACRPR